MLLCGRLSAQTAEFDVFIPIGKYMAQGDADKLSAWFDDNLEIAVVSQASSASKAQARQILRTFFESNSPRSMSMTAGKSMPYNFAQGFVELTNGHLLKGAGCFMRRIGVPRLPKEEK